MLGTCEPIIGMPGSANCRAPLNTRACWEARMSAKKHNTKSCQGLFSFSAGDDPVRRPKSGRYKRNEVRLTKKVCPECGIVFRPSWSQRKYCSRPCSGRATHRLGLNPVTHQVIPDDVILEAVRRINAGERRLAVYKSLGISESTLGNRVKRLGCQVRRGSVGEKKEIHLKLPERATDLAYIAAMVDGEGCISITEKGNARGVRITVVNTYKPMIEWLWAFGGTISSREPRTIGRKMIYEWRICKRADATALLEAILPYMQIKRKRAECALALLARIATPDIR